MQQSAVTAWRSAPRPTQLTAATVANTPTVQVDLNEATLLNSMIAIRTNFKDQAGLKVFARGRRLVVPPQLRASCYSSYKD
jgi:hypothetical protein